MTDKPRHIDDVLNNSFNAPVRHKTSIVVDLDSWTALKNYCERTDGANTSQIVDALIKDFNEEMGND